MPFKRWELLKGNCYKYLYGNSGLYLQDVQNKGLRKKWITENSHIPRYAPRKKSDILLFSHNSLLYCKSQKTAIFNFFR